METSPEILPSPDCGYHVEAAEEDQEDDEHDGHDDEGDEGDLGQESDCAHLLRMHHGARGRRLLHNIASNMLKLSGSTIHTMPLDVKLTKKHFIKIFQDHKKEPFPMDLADLVFCTTLVLRKNLLISAGI